MVINNQDINFIGAALGWGAQIIETEQGPDALKSYLQDFGNWQTTIYPEHPTEADYEQRLSFINKECQSLAFETAAIIKENKFPVVLGGDHSIAIGSWSGITTELSAKQSFGLIWVDAHMDAHTPDTSPSKAIHGMPVAVLLGQGEDSLVNICSKGAKINPKHLVLMGIRSYESGEAALLEKLGVRVITMDEIKQKGFSALMDEAIDRVTSGTKAFGLSIDLDGFDPKAAPGVGSPEGEGLMPEQVLPALEKIASHPSFRALEIAEYNPELDQGKKTAKLVQEIIKTISK